MSAGEENISEVGASFGQWAKLRRKTLRLTQAELAKRAHCSTEYIRKIERDARRPAEDLAERLAQELAMPAATHPLFVAVARGARPVDLLPPPVKIHDEVLRSFVNGADSARAATAAFCLPQLTTSTVGRSTELKTIATRLADQSCRLLSLIGPGGVGKTHLAIEAAQNAHNTFGDGRCWIALAGLSRVEQMVWTIADNLALSLNERTDPQQALIDYLRRKKLLLVLDNFEHLIEGIDLLMALLMQTSVTLLVTSRERLRLPHEWVLDIQDLSHSEPAALDSSAHLMPPQNEAVDSEEPLDAYRLFLARAEQLHSGFPQRLQADVTEEQEVHRICSMLGGLPLAIEMAALWTRVLSCREIAENIAQSIDFLQATEQIPRRHRSLRAIFNYSWSLLPQTERALLAQLSIFPSAFTRAAAEAVAGTNLSRLLALVDKSFLRVSENGRYVIVQALSAFAREKLDGLVTEREETQRRYCRYYGHQLRHIAAEMSGPQGETALQEIRSEFANLEVAWLLASQQNQWDSVEEMIDALHRFAEMQGRFAQMHEMFSAALGVLPASDRLARLRTKLLCRVGYLQARLGKYEPAIQMLAEAQCAANSTEQQAENALCTVGLAMIARDQGRYADAQQLYTNALLVFDQAGDDWQSAHTCNNLGIVFSRLGEGHRARNCYEESLAHFRRVGSQWGQTLPLNNLAVLAYAQKQYAEADALFRENLNNYAAFGDRKGEALTLSNLGTVAMSEERLDSALSHFEKSLLLCQQIGDRWLIVNTLASMGQVETTLGYTDRAQRTLHTALAEAVELDSASMILFIFVGVGALFAQQQKGERALALWEIVEEHPAAKQETRDLAQRTASRVRMDNSEHAARSHRYDGLLWKELVAQILDELSLI